MSTIAASSYEHRSMASSSRSLSSSYSTTSSLRKKRKKKKKVYAEFVKDQNGFVIPTDLWELARNSLRKQGKIRDPIDDSRNLKGIVDIHIEEEKKDQNNMYDPIHIKNHESGSSSTYEDGVDEDDDSDDDDDEKDIKLIVDYLFDNNATEMKQSIKIQTSREQLETEKTNRKLRLLDKISQVQRQYLVKEEPAIVFGGLLDCLLDVMDSEYGFIGEVKWDDNGDMYLFTHATTNIAWNAATRKFYDDNITADGGLAFRNMKSLFGTVLTTQETLIANVTKNHPNGCGIPDGHPPLNHFLGIPFFVQNGTVLNGMVGIANKPGGYTQQDVEFLEPLVVTCSNLIQAYNTHRENEFLINKLEDLVVLRTNELELANQKVVEAAKMQMEHFACMSHEIRTPLNCVIGLTSLLQQETNFTPYQQDSLSMIIKSGELLMAVVNDVLDYSKLQTDNMTMEINDTSLQDTLDSVVHSIENKASDKNVTLQTHYNPNVPNIFATDSRRLQQILYNLLGNAIKFSKNNDKVELNISVVQTDSSYDISDDHKKINQLNRENLISNNQITDDQINVNTNNDNNNGTNDNDNNDDNAIIESHPNRPSDVVGGKTVGSLMTDRRRKLISSSTYQSVSSFYHSITSTKMDCSSVDAEEDYSINDGDHRDIDEHNALMIASNNDLNMNDDDNTENSDVMKLLEFQLSHHSRKINMNDHNDRSSIGNDDDDTDHSSNNKVVVDTEKVLKSPSVHKYPKKADSTITQVSETDIDNMDSMTGNTQVSLSSPSENANKNTNNDNNSIDHDSIMLLQNEDNDDDNHNSINIMNYNNDRNKYLSEGEMKLIPSEINPLSPSDHPMISSVEGINCHQQGPIFRSTSSISMFPASPSRSSKCPYHSSKDTNLTNNDYNLTAEQWQSDNIENSKNDNLDYNNITITDEKEKEKPSSSTSEVVSRCPFMKSSSSVPSIAPLSEETDNSDNVGTSSTTDVQPNPAPEPAISRCPFMKQSQSIPAASSDQVDHHRDHQNEEPAEQAKPNDNEIDAKHGSAHELTIQPPQYIGDDFGSETKYILRFVVKDYGKGIAKADFYKIFQPFQQAKSGKNTVHEGTGLGLAITSRLVNGLGGSVTVDSELGKWTQFTLDLPILGDYDVSQLSPVIQKLHDHRARILVVTNDSETSMLEECAILHDIEYHKYDSCQTLLSVRGSPSESCKNDVTNVCIIHEDLYDAKMYETLSNRWKNVILMTFGPNYSVKESRKHYRSILRTIPSMMMQSILNCIEEHIEQQKNHVAIAANGYCSSVSHPNQHGHHPPMGIGSITSSNEMTPPVVINYEHLCVLIAEDNIINQKVLSQMLKRLGIKNVDIVDNGLKAVEESEKKDYDVLLLDMQMPVMGGLEASRIIVDRYSNMIPKKTKPYIAFVTAHASVEYETLAKEAGGDDFITKPFSLQMIKTFFESLDPYLLQSCSIQI